MDHAKLEKGEVLIDVLNCCNVEIVETPEYDDLPPKEYYVMALDKSNRSYSVHEKYLFTNDEISSVFSFRSVVDYLKGMREERIKEQAPLLRHIDFDPENVTEEDINRFKALESALDEIWKSVKVDVIRSVWISNHLNVTIENISNLIITKIGERVNHTYEKIREEES